MKSKLLKTAFCSLIVLAFSCNEKVEGPQDVSVDYSEGKDYPIISSEDDFDDGFSDFWRFQRVTEDHIAIAEDPADANNKVMKVKLAPDDFNRGGNRSELVINSHDSLGYKSSYSFRFYLPESFFKTEEQNNWFMIHQWHDEPQAGYTWKTNQHKTRPPASLIIQFSVEEGYKLVYVTGLQTGNLKEAKIISAPVRLEPDTWYEFSNEVFWSVYDADGYSLPSLNGEPFTTEFAPDGKIFGRNMYNTRGSFYKYGLYSSGKQKHERHLYFDDFKMKSQRAGYGLVKH